jgi:two-component sensor histidine kinase
MVWILKSIALRNATLVVMFLFSILDTKGQTISSKAAVKSYSIIKDRLLVITTSQYINFLTQNNLDQDSIRLIACRVTGQPFLLPYTEGFYNKKGYRAADMINKGEIQEAIRLLDSQRGEQQIILLLELSAWFLHQSGAHVKDLNYAASFLNLADKLVEGGKFESWRTECKFIESELWHQRNADRKSKEILSSIISASSVPGKELQSIRALQQMATLSNQTDSSKLIYLNKALSVCRKKQLKEKEIELLFLTAISHVVGNGKLLEQDMLQAMVLMRSIDFKHTLYAQNILSYAYIIQTKNLEAFQTARAALKNMEWSNIKAVSGSFYYRLGSCYWTLNKMDDALYWYKRSLSTGSFDTHIFWYKSLFFATTLLYSTGKYGESLTLLDSVIRTSPPVTLWEKFQVLSIKSSCYSRLNKTHKADKINLVILDLANKNPSMDSFGELAPTFYEIVENYIAQGNVTRANLFLKKAMEKDPGNADMQYFKYTVLYKIDSLKGNYKKALLNHILYKKYYDSYQGMDQRKKLDELTVKYETEKKDQDIRLLKEQRAAQLSELKRSKLTQNIVIAGAGLLFVIIALLFYMYQIKQTTNRAINKKNKTLEHLLHEKEWLLKEVNHRVKNNLHTVICLLESQAVYLQDDALTAIENSQHRIYAMSLIHKKLYQSEDLKTVEMNSYLPEFVGYLKDSIVSGNQISFDLAIDPLRLGVSYAVPISLIINEAVTNAIKYAFPFNRNGSVTLSMHKKGDYVLLIIADDGIGIADEKISAPTNSLGLKLIHGLVDDIQGSIKITNDTGTNIKIQFPFDPSSTTDAA